MFAHVMINLTSKGRPYVVQTLPDYNSAKLPYYEKAILIRFLSDSKLQERKGVWYILSDETMKGSLS